MTDIVVRVVSAGVDAEELDGAVQGLLVELDEAGIDAARQTAGRAPDGTRGAELAEIGMVVVQGLVETGALRAVIDRVRSWFGRSGVNEVEIAIGENRLSLSHATAEEQEMLVRHFIAATES